MKACLEQIFVLSTGHITQEDAQLFDTVENLEPLTVHSYSEYGWIIVIPNDIGETRDMLEETLSDAFWNILKNVKALYPECGRIQLDRDGNCVEDFPIFEW